MNLPADKAPHPESKPSGFLRVLVWLVFAAAVLSLLVSGFCAIGVSIIGLYAPDNLMLLIGLTYAAPAALVSGLLAWWMRRIINRWKRP